MSQGRGVFLELGHFDKHFIYNTGKKNKERRGKQSENFGFFLLGKNVYIVLSPQEEEVHSSS